MNTQRQTQITVDYDSSADVLYISKGILPPDCYDEDEEGLIWRFDSLGNPQGVTVLDFKEYWSLAEMCLSKRIADFLKIPEKDVKLALQILFSYPKKGFLFSQNNPLPYLFFKLTHYRHSIPNYFFNNLRKKIDKFAFVTQIWTKKKTIEI